ncbi:type II toxin-antitoxin system HipA family toxin [Halomonas sp. SL1]|uniref:type II toxin-antitoxin system HipA family toxin n=1 Tax=Halomonas sp. SL1 TaxID=2137478 RepID=UPI000D177E6B|nr:HipA domain-containing protein [Halomonas sp. SL1]RAH36682.1 type II toxin-antitoxin system HipA family toxin [Halomonas sp. SL1]
MQLTIQIHHQTRWQDAALLEIPAPEQGTRGPARLGYFQDYALAWMFHDDEHACSLTLPVELMMTHRGDRWFGFLEDIMPAGASRRYWIEHLGLQDLDPGQQDSELLRRGTIAPVGNLRIREALPERPAGDALASLRFPQEEVLERHTDFLEYAQQMGAASGGATGAGGEAPKLLVRRTPDRQVWIDTWQDDTTTPDAHYLVKFPRGSRSDDDCDILRAEYHYYRELHALGVDTVPVEGLELHEGTRYPSLWLPRFDVEWRQGQLHRHGLESVYALLGVAPGTHLRHPAAIRRLVALLKGQHRVREGREPFDAAAFVIEWVKRDLLNLAFGNSDNHGRNAALLKRPEGIWHAPVYDFAPMKADPEGVPRTTQWGPTFERGGDVDWPAVAEHLADLVEPERLMGELRALGDRLPGLRDRLADHGVPSRILDMPAVGLNHLNDRLTRWGLT